MSKKVKIDPNQPALAVKQYGFSPVEYYKPKVYKKHLRTLAKIRHTTDVLAPTIGCGHCKQWINKNKKPDTDIQTPITGVDMNVEGICKLHSMTTAASQYCHLFYPNTSIEIPEGYARPRKNYGPKDNK